MKVQEFRQDIHPMFCNVNGVGYQWEQPGVKLVLATTHVATWEYAKKKIPEMVTYVCVLLDLAGKLVRK
jgi:hypothetical protein